METKDKEIDLKKLWWVFKKYLLWIVIAAVLGGVALGVYTAITTETTYTTKTIFLVGSGNDITTSNNSATTDYYKIQKAREDAIDIIESVKFSTTVKKVMNDARNPETDPELEPAEIKKISGMISAKILKDDSRMFVLSVKSTSADYSLWVSQAFEQHLPNYITNDMKQLNASLSVREDVNSKYITSAPGAAETTYHVPADKVPLERNAALGAIAFAVLAYIAFFVYTSLDNTIRSSEGLADRFPQIPVLGHIPEWRAKKFSRRQKKLERMGRLRDYDEKLLADSTSFSVAESFRGLRTNISYIVSGKSTVVGVTSAKTGECKSVVAANLAVCYAQLKKKVLLVEGDMRLPSQHDIFDISPETGLPEILAGIETDYHNCIHAYNENLDILPVGVQTPPNPAELLASDATEELFDKLRTEYDLIIFDLPPLGTVSDAGIVSNVVDYYLLSARVESTNARTLAGVLRDMQRLDMKACGFVVSGLVRSGKYSKSPYYYDKYGQRRRKDELETAQAAEEAPADGE